MELQVHLGHSMAGKTWIFQECIACYRFAKEFVVFAPLDSNSKPKTLKLVQGMISPNKAVDPDITQHDSKLLIRYFQLTSLCKKDHCKPYSSAWHSRSPCKLGPLVRDPMLENSDNLKHGIKDAKQKPFAHFRLNPPMMPTICPSSPVHAAHLTPKPLRPKPLNP